MSMKSIGEKEGCGTVIQDYLINAGGNSRQPSCLVRYLQISQIAVCEMISYFSVERVMLSIERKAGDVNEPKQLGSQDSCVDRCYLDQPPTHNKNSMRLGF